MKPANVPPVAWEDRGRVNFSTESLEREWDELMGRAALEALAALSRKRRLADDLRPYEPRGAPWLKGRKL